MSTLSTLSLPNSVIVSSIRHRGRRDPGANGSDDRRSEGNDGRGPMTNRVPI